MASGTRFPATLSSSSLMPLLISEIDVGVDHLTEEVPRAAGVRLAVETTVDLETLQCQLHLAPKTRDRRRHSGTPRRTDSCRSGCGSKRGHGYATNRRRANSKLEVVSDFFRWSNEGAGVLGRFLHIANDVRSWATMVSPIDGRARRGLPGKSNTRQHVIIVCTAVEVRIAEITKFDLVALETQSRRYR